MRNTGPDSPGITRLYPSFKVLEGKEAVYQDLEFPDPEEPGDRDLPFVYINMVSSIDGKVAVSGKSGAIGSDVDRSTMRELRSLSDAVMVGSGTLRAEKVSLTSEGRRRPEPLAIVVSSSLDIPLKENLKDAEKDRTVVITTERSLKNSKPEDLDEISSRARVLAAPEKKSSEGTVDLREALGLLGSGYGVRRLLAEGGPGLNYELISSGVARELFLTLSPQILAGEPERSLNIVSGRLLERGARARLISLHQADGELFLRYSLADSSG